MRLTSNSRTQHRAPARPWEEINEGIPGANYGWPNTEGPTSDPNFVSPLHAYPNSGAVECAIAGGAFYAPEVRQFPATYTDSYFFSDLCGGWIRRLNTSNASNDFATGIGNPVDVLVGHDGSLYSLARSGGQLLKITWDAHLEGDVDGDGATTNADAFYLINHFHAGGPAPVQGGDVNGDGSVNTADLTYLLAYLLGRGPTPL